jgi:hypothetical protein
LFRHILQALQTLRVCLFGLAKRRIPFRVKCHVPIIAKRGGNEENIIFARISRLSVASMPRELCSFGFTYE